MKRREAFGLGVLLLVVAGAPSAQASPPTPEEAQAQWLRRLDGQHFTATLLRRVENRGRRMNLYRDDLDGAERLLIRLEQPRAVAGQSWLLRERPGQAPALHFYSSHDRDPSPRSIPSLKVRNPLEGADPHLLGVRAAWPAPKPESLEQSELEGRRIWILTERAVDETTPYERRRVWIDPETWMALRVEHERGGQVVMSGEVIEVRDVQGVSTALRVAFEHPGEPRVRFRFETMDYRRPIRPAYLELPD